MHDAVHKDCKLLYTLDQPCTYARCVSQIHKFFSAKASCLELLRRIQKVVLATAMAH